MDVGGATRGDFLYDKRASPRDAPPTVLPPTVLPPTVLASHSAGLPQTFQPQLGYE